MNENEGILELIEMLYTMISDAWSVPLGNDKCLVDREKALDLIEEIKAQLPVEMAEAKRLVSARDEFITNARKEAESVRKAAEERARKLVDEQEVVRSARIKAEEMLTTADNKSRELRRAASEYLAESLQNAEESMAQALDIVRKTRGKFRSASSGMGGSAPRREQ